MIEKRSRPLLIAEAANPQCASAPLAGGWSARALMDRPKEHWVTQARNREAMLRTGPIESDDVTFINSEPVAARDGKLAHVSTLHSEWRCSAFGKRLALKPGIRKAAHAAE